MKSQLNAYALILFIFLCFIACISFTQAAKAELSTSENAAASSQDLLNTLQQLNDELTVLNGEYASAEDLERDILRSQIRAKRKQIAKGLKELNSEIRELEAEKQDV